MKIEGEYTFDGTRQDVWQIVRDPEVLATALPGTQKLTQVGENEYEGEINVRIGPVGGTFSGKIIVSQEVPPESYTLSVEGKGKPGFLKGSGDVQLLEQTGAQTLMKYAGEVQIGGRLASVGQRMIDTVSKSMIKQGLETLNQALQKRVGAEGPGGEEAHKAPSEMEFATAVAKDMAGQALSSRLIWIAAIILIILVIIAVVVVGRGIW
jgi:carbon monoxide dehydrogenase subunit G